MPQYQGAHKHKSLGQKPHHCSSHRWKPLNPCRLCPLQVLSRLVRPTRPSIGMKEQPRKLPHIRQHHPPKCPLPLQIPMVRLEGSPNSQIRVLLPPKAPQPPVQQWHSNLRRPQSGPKPVVVSTSLFQSTYLPRPPHLQRRLFNLPRAQTPFQRLLDQPRKILNRLQNQVLSRKQPPDSLNRQAQLLGKGSLRITIISQLQQRRPLKARRPSAPTTQESPLYRSRTPTTYPR